MSQGWVQNKVVLFHCSFDIGWRILLFPFCFFFLFQAHSRHLIYKRLFSKGKEIALLFSFVIVLGPTFNPDFLSYLVNILKKQNEAFEFGFANLDRQAILVKISTSHHF